MISIDIQMQEQAFGAFVDARSDRYMLLPRLAVTGIVRPMSIHESAGEDLLGRAPLIAACTRLLELPEGPRVLSVEAGYGEGKTVFAELWRDALAKGTHVPVLFNAWRSDHAEDPLAVFLAVLAEAVPLPEDTARKDKAKRVLGAFKTIGAAGARAVGTALVGRAADTMTDGVADLVAAVKDDVPEAADDMARVEAFLEAEGKTIDKALTAAVMEQLTALASRRTALPRALDTLYRDLMPTPCACICEERDEGGCHGKGPCNTPEDAPACKCTCGKIVVLIDELDRCRPDFAVGLLEAIKHLFEDHPGFRFALMLNPGRLEATAGAMFGVAEGGERYLTKFIDQRLRLPAEKAGRRKFMAHLADPEWFGTFTPWAEGLKVLGDKHTLDLVVFTEEHGFSLREIAQAFETARLTFALYPNEPVEPTFLVALSLVRGRNTSIRPSGVDEIDCEQALNPYRQVVAAHPATKGYIIYERIHRDLNEIESDTRNPDNSKLTESEIRMMQNEYHKAYDLFRLHYDAAVKILGTPSRKRYQGFGLSRGDYPPEHFGLSI